MLEVQSENRQTLTPISILLNTETEILQESMQADLNYDNPELIVCMTSKIERSRFLDIFKIPIKAQTAEMVYYRQTMEVVNKNVHE